MNEQLAVNEDKQNQVSSDSTNQLPKTVNEQDITTEQTDSNNGNSVTPPVNEETEDKQQTQYVPYSRLKQVIDERNELRERLKQTSQQDQFDQTPYVPQPIPTDPVSGNLNESIYDELARKVDNGEMSEFQATIELKKYEEKQMREQANLIQTQNRLAQIAQSRPDLFTQGTPAYEALGTALETAKCFDQYGNVDFKKALPIIQALGVAIPPSQQQTPNTVQTTYQQTRQDNVQKSQMNVFAPVNKGVADVINISDEEAMIARKLGVDPTSDTYLAIKNKKKGLYNG